MSSSYFCPCCFLDRVSSVRNTPEFSWKPIYQEAHQEYFTTTSLSKKTIVNANSSASSNINKACSEVSNMDHSSLSLVKFDSAKIEGHSLNFIHPESLVNKLGNFQSSETFTIEESNPSSLQTVGSKTGRPASVVESRDRTVFLTNQIDCMLQEQRKFLREFELPINDEEGFRFINDEVIEVEVTNEGDSVTVNRKTTSKASEQKKGRNKKIRTQRFTNEAVHFASGDQDNIINFIDGKNSSDDTMSVPFLNFDEVKQSKKHKKGKGNFKEEPVKLSKQIEWAVPLQTNFDYNQDHNTDKTMSVKMIFCPEGEIKCSTTSIESCGEANSIATTSSAYVTAVNSYNDGLKELNINEGMYTNAGSTSNMPLNITHSESRGSIKRE